MKRLLLSFAIGVWSLTGCVRPQPPPLTQAQAVQWTQSQSDYSLCEQAVVHNNGGGNIGNELMARRVDCSKYSVLLQQSMANKIKEDSKPNGFQQFSEDIAKAAKYGQPPAVKNLTGGTTQNQNNISCTPDGRGGYNCR